MRIGILAKMIPKARVVSAFNTVPGEVLFGVYEARLEANRPSLVLLRRRRERQSCGR